MSASSSATLENYFVRNLSKEDKVLDSAYFVILRNNPSRFFFSS